MADELKEALEEGKTEEKAEIKEPEKKATKPKASKKKETPAKVEAEPKEECKICATKSRLEASMASLANALEISSAAIETLFIDESAVTVAGESTEAGMEQAKTNAALKVMAMLTPGEEAPAVRGRRVASTQAESKKSPVSEALTTVRQFTSHIQMIAEAHKAVGECDCDE